MQKRKGSSPTSKENSKLEDTKLQLTTQAEEPPSPTEPNQNDEAKAPKLARASLQYMQPEDLYQKNLDEMQILELQRENRQKKCRRGVRIFYLLIFLVFGIIFPITFTMSKVNQGFIHLKTDKNLNLILEYCTISFNADSSLEENVAKIE